jgi:hypothetical protein
MQMHRSYVVIAALSFLTAGCAMIGGRAQRQHGQVQLEFQTVEVENAAIGSLGGVALFTPSSLAKLTVSNRASIMSTVVLTTEFGATGTVKGVSEWIYPTEFTATGMQGQGQYGKAEAPAGALVEPGNFETREVGVIMNVLAEADTSQTVISLTLTPEFVSDPRWEEYYVATQIADGPATNAAVKQPIFDTQSLATSVLVRDNEPFVLSACPKRGSNKTVVLLVCARIIK